MALVSVVIPTYNRADLIGDAIRSVFEQTYGDWEIIVVDDGSTDNTAEVVASFGERVRYIPLPHGGVSAARNRGVREARGQYVAFLDSDDLFLPHKLERQIALFEQRPELGMVYGSYRSVDAQLNPLQEHRARRYPGGYSEMMLGCTIATPTVMARREVLEQIGPFDETMHLAEDIDLWCRIYRHYPIEPVDDPVTLVRIHGAATSRDPEEVLNAYMHLLLKAFRADRSLGFIYRRKALARMHYICAAEVLARVDPNSTDPHKYQTYNFYFLKAARFWPFSKLGMNTLLGHYSGRIGSRLRRAFAAVRGLDARQAQIVSDLQAQVQSLRAQLQAVSPPGTDHASAANPFSLNDLEPIAAWMGRTLPGNEAYPIFHKHGFHVLRRHYYTPIPEADEAARAQIVSELPGIAIDMEAAFELLETAIQPYKAEFEQFPIRADGLRGANRFYLLNGAFMAIDGNVYYGLIRHYKPRRIIEIGSGFSTQLAAAAIRANRSAGEQPTQLICIEPYPPPALEQLDDFIRLKPFKVQDIGLDVFTALGENDILFIDSSHVLRMGNDVWYEYCELLPRLRPGVLVHIHDVSLPKPYPQVYFDKQLFWNEQYLLQAMLAHNPHYEVLWPGNYLMTHHAERMRAAFTPEYDHMRAEFPSSEPTSFWLRVR